MRGDGGELSHRQHRVLEVKEEAEVERHVERADILGVQLLDRQFAELELLQLEGALDEVGLVDIAVHHVDAEHVLRSVAGRLHGEPAAVAADVENPLAGKRAAEELEQGRPGAELDVPHAM